jgi:hypothetical protein
LEELKKAKAMTQKIVGFLSKFLKKKKNGGLDKQKSQISLRIIKNSCCGSRLWNSLSEYCRR